MKNPLQKNTMFSLLFILLLFISLTGVSSATFNNTSSTEDIQKFIDNNSSDNKLILDGKFNNLSTLNINRPMKISGNNNAIITKSSSNTSNILFNITVPNVIIENLMIKGYDKAIFSNKGNITIQNNQIYSTNVAIDIDNHDEDISGVIIKNNKISTIETYSYGISLYGYNGAVRNNNITNNIIETFDDSSIGIDVNSMYGIVNNNNIYGNTIRTKGIYAYGIRLNGGYTTASNNNLYENNIYTKGRASNGIYIYAWLNNSYNKIYNNIIQIDDWADGIALNSILNSVINNIDIFSNDIIVKDRGIYIYADNISGLNVSYNRIISENLIIELSSKSIDRTDSENRFFANWLGTNNPDISKIININMINYYVFNVTLKTNKNYVGDNWIFDYKFILNDTNDTGDLDKLPTFNTIFTDDKDNILRTVLAKSGLVYVPINKNVNNMSLSLTIDNQTFLFYVSSEEKPSSNSTPTIPPKPTPTPMPTPTQEPIDKNQTNNINKNSKTINNPTTYASMKSTGIPFIVILLLLNSIGLIIRKKQ